MSRIRIRFLRCIGAAAAALACAGLSPLAAMADSPDSGAASGGPAVSTAGAPASVSDSQPAATSQPAPIRCPTSKVPYLRPRLEGNKTATMGRTHRQPRPAVPHNA